MSKEIHPIGDMMKSSPHGWTGSLLPELEDRARDLLKEAFSRETTLSMRLECTVDEQSLAELFSYQKDDPLFDLVYYIAKPARTHRKRRIRKKWLKKYGWRSTPVTVSGCKLIDRKDGSFELIKEVK